MSESVIHAESPPERRAADAVIGGGAPDPSRRPLARRTYRWVKKVHMYLGLLVYVQFTIYGIAGLNATFAEAPAQREPFPSTASSVEFSPPAGASDKAVADEIHALLDPPLAGPVPDWALARTPGDDLRVNFYSVNGPTRVTVLADEERLEIEQVRNSFVRFLSNAHATTFREYTGDPRLFLWASLNELGIWSLLILALSGVYLWLASRPRLRLAVASFAGGLTAFIFLWIAIR